MESKTETRGRKRLPEGKHKPPQATVKINAFILPFVKELKGNLKKGIVSSETLLGLFSVLRGTGQQVSAFKDPEAVSIVLELQEKIHQLEADKRLIERELAKQQKISLNLAQERDKEHFNAIHTEGKLDSLKSSYRLLKYDHEALLHREHDCMALKGDGQRCTKKATNDTVQNGILIHVCVQHAKSLAKRINK